MSALLLSPLPIFPEPYLLFGGSVTGITFQEEASPADADLAAGLHLLASTRSSFGEGAYTSLAFDTTLGRFLLNPSWYDEERLSAEIGFEAGPGHFLAVLLAESALFGEAFPSVYAHTNLDIRYYFAKEENKLEPYAALRGAWKARFSDDQDSIYVGGLAGIDYRPSIFLGFDIGAGGGMEVFPEFPVHTDTGTISDSERSDFLAELLFSADGFIGYYVDWSFDLTGRYRSSNASSWFAETGYFEEKGEDRLEFFLEGTIGINPAKSAAFVLEPYGRFFYYLYRDADGGLVSYDINETDILAGLSVEFDWNPGSGFFLFCKITGEGLFSIDSGLESFAAEVEAGLEYIF